jgi:copper resistance protein C
MGDESPGLKNKKSHESMRKNSFSMTAILMMAGLGGTASAMTQQAFPVAAAETIDAANPQLPTSGPADPFAISGARPELPVWLAHAILVKASPAQEAVVSDIPEEILLIFNDGVGEQYLALAVTDEAGKRVDNHDAKLDFTDRSHLRATVAKLNPGRYMVRYRVLSADGHVVSGKYYFQIQGKK